MVISKINIFACRVCGLVQPEPPWGFDGISPAEVICPCCGIEFGYEDSTQFGVFAAREKWKKSGCKWFFPKQKPEHWDVERQLKNIPTEYL